MSPSVTTQTLNLIQAELNDYLEDPQTMDFQDFAGFCRDFVDESYTDKKLKIVYDFLSKQQCINDEAKDEENEDAEIKTNFFLQTIAQYASVDDMDDIDSVMMSVFDEICLIEQKNKV